METEKIEHLPTIRKKALIWSPTVLAFIAGLAAAFLMPRVSPFAYNFQIGSVWNYPDLKSPFDYEVLRTEASISDAIAEINKSHRPYFKQNQEIARIQKKKIVQLIENQISISKNDTQFDDLKSNSVAYSAFAQGLIDKIYRKGIVQNQDLEERGLLVDSIYVLKGRELEKIAFSSLLTPATAKEFLIDSLPFSPLRQPEILLPLLDKVIVPNTFYSDSLSIAGKREKIAHVQGTGLRVARGETIIRKGDMVQDETFMKLDSLSRRFDQPKGWRVLAGYFLVASICFLTFFSYLKRHYPLVWHDPKKALLPILGALVIIGAVGILANIGLAVPLILPIFGFPVLLTLVYNRKVALFCWGITILLTTFSLDWGTGWIIIQLCGGLTAWSLMPLAKTWKARGIAMLMTCFAATTGWVAAALAERIPDAGRSFDVILFLFAAALISLIVFPIRTYFYKHL